MRFLILLMVVMPAFVAGQIQKGILAGTVTDATNKQPLAGANVVVEGTTMGAATDMDGEFVITGLQPGSYNIGIYFLGYETVMKANVVINPGNKSIIRVEMTPDLLESEAVEVTASYFSQPREAVVSARSMDFEEVRRSPGSALDIQRVMQSLPSVVSGSDQNNEIIIRGGNPGENLFLMDDVEIPNPNHFGEQGSGGGPINMINTLMVGQVDFYAGAFPAKYGDKASSVMDIRLRDGSRDQFKTTLDMGMAGAGVISEGPLNGGRGSYILSARRSYLDLIVDAIGLVAIPRYYNLQGRLSYDLTPSSTLIFNMMYGRDKIHIQDEGGAGYSRGAENVKSNGGQYAVGLSLRSVFSPNFYGRTTFSVAQSEWDVDVYRTLTGKTYFSNRSREKETTLKSDFTYSLKSGVEFNWGAQIKQVNFNLDVFSAADTLFTYDPAAQRPDSATGIARVYAGDSFDDDLNSYKTALYGQVSFDFLKRFTLTAGARYEYFKYTGFHSLSPRLGMRWKLSPQSTLNLAYGRHYQSPVYFQLLQNRQNRSLDSYYSEQFIAGFEYLLRSDIKFTLEAYRKTYEGLPQYRRLTTADPLDYYDNEMLNSGRGRSRGVETFLQKKITDNFSGIVSYSFSRSENLDLRDNSWYAGNYDYRHVLTLIAGYKIRFYKQEWFKQARESWWYRVFATILPFSDETEVSVKYRYLGGRPYTSPVYHPELRRWLVDENLKRNATRLPEYSRLDVRLDRRYFFDSWNMVVYFDASNVLNTKNIWEYQYNDDGGTREILQFQPLLVGGVNIEF